MSISAGDETSECRQQIGVQAGFRLIEHHQRWRSRAQRRGDQQQVAEGSVGELSCGEGPQTSRGPSILDGIGRELHHLQVGTAGKRASIVPCSASASPISMIVCQGCREVSAFGIERRRTSADVAIPDWGVSVGAELVVNLPAANLSRTASGWELTLDTAPR